MNDVDYDPAIVTVSLSSSDPEEITVFLNFSYQLVCTVNFMCKKF